MRDILPAILAFVCGALVGFLNSRVTKAALKKGAAGFSLIPLRIAIISLFILTLVLISEKLGLGFGVRIAGAVGLTLSILIFTLMLIKEPAGPEEEDKGNG